MAKSSPRMKLKKHVCFTRTAHVTCSGERKKTVHTHTKRQRHQPKPRVKQFLFQNELIAKKVSIELLAHEILYNWHFLHFSSRFPSIPFVIMSLAHFFSSLSLCMYTWMQIHFCCRFKWGDQCAHWEKNGKKWKHIIILTVINACSLKCTLIIMPCKFDAAR